MTDGAGAQVTLGFLILISELCYYQHVREVCTIRFLILIILTYYPVTINCPQNNVALNTRIIQQPEKAADVLVEGRAAPAKA